MRGTTSRQVTTPGWIDPGELIPARHPIRRVKPLKSCLLMALYAIRSERQFCEQLRYDLLFK